jgi:hypothetical protein
VWLALLVTSVYIVVIGAPAPAVRSAVMLGASAVSRLTQRPTSPWAGLALGAWAPAVNPRIITDLGYQLSVAGLGALIASGVLARRLLAGRVDGWRRVVVRDLIVSTVASIVTLPLIAWTFGRLSSSRRSRTSRRDRSSPSSNPPSSRAAPVTVACRCRAHGRCGARDAGCGRCRCRSRDTDSVRRHSGFAEPLTTSLLGVVAVSLVVACSSAAKARGMLAD